MRFLRKKDSHTFARIFWVKLFGFFSFFILFLLAFLVLFRSCNIILLRISIETLLISLIPHMTDALDVLVGIELRAVGLNHGYGHVGAVGCHTCISFLILFRNMISRGHAGQER